MQHLPLPGQGSAGTQRKIEFSTALPFNGLPAEATPSGYIGNCTAPLFPVVTADGSRQETDYTDQEGLELSLALAVAVVRKEILALRQPGAAVKAVLDTATLVPAEGSQMMVDSFGTQPLDTAVAPCAPLLLSYYSLVCDANRCLCLSCSVLILSRWQGAHRHAKHNERLQSILSYDICFCAYLWLSHGAWVLMKL